MKRLLLFGPAAILVTLAHPALAAKETCDLTAEYKALASIIQTQEDIQKELSARVSLLSATIACAREDVIVLKSQVLADDTSAAQEARERLTEALDEAIRFYDIKKDSLKDQGIQGTKDIAREIKSWRNNNYAQLSGRVKNFVLWSANQPLFEKASDRLSQSQLVVTSLKVLELENKDSGKIYFEAKTRMESAEELNRKAGDAIARNAPSEETFGVIKDSLEALSNAYKNFFEISGQLNKTNVPAQEDSASEEEAPKE